MLVGQMDFPTQQLKYPVPGICPGMIKVQLSLKNIIASDIPVHSVYLTFLFKQFTKVLGRPYLLNRFDYFLWTQINATAHNSILENSLLQFYRNSLGRAFFYYYMTMPLCTRPELIWTPLVWLAGFEPNTHHPNPSMTRTQRLSHLRTEKALSKGLQ